MSGYSWTLPAQQAATGDDQTLQQNEQLRLLGQDIFFDGDMHVTPAGDYVLVSGMEALRQAIYRRLVTRPGEYRVRPSYGVGVQDYVKKRRLASTLDELKVAITDQLSFDQRIDEVADVVVEYISDGIKVGIAIRAAGETLRFRPFDFTEKNLIGTL